MSHATTIALIHAPQAALCKLQHRLEAAGFTVVNGLAADVYQGRLDLEDLVAREGVRVVVWDMAPPYEIEWRAFRLLRARPGLQGCRFVITCGAGALNSLESAADLRAVFGSPRQPSTPMH
jgi:hypothetical protein